MVKQFQFKTSRLVIRPWVIGDAEGLQRAVNYQAVTRMTSSMPYPYTLNDARFWIRKTQRYFRQRPIKHMHFALTHNEVVVGSIGTDRDGGQAELGYWLTPHLHGQGIISEAVRSFVPIVFKTWPVHRMVAKVFLFNPASARVLEKCKFRLTALEASAILKNGKWLDALVYTRYR